LYKRDFIDCLFTWVFTLFIWYTIFTTTLSDFAPYIIIGGKHTDELINYLLSNDGLFWFEGLCYQTVYIFDVLSTKIGLLIFIPTYFSPIFNKSNKTKCAGNGNSKKNSSSFAGSSQKSSDKSSSSDNDKSWFSNPDKKQDKINKTDFYQCEDMAGSGSMKRSRLNVFQRSATEISEDGERKVTATETYVPFMGIQRKCLSSDLTELEKDLIKSSKARDAKKKS
jgi:hypothetical protein